MHGQLWACGIENLNTTERDRTRINIINGHLAQLDRAAPYEGEGSGFDSLSDHHKRKMCYA